jgi:hypothetical protein
LAFWSRDEAAQRAAAAAQSGAPRSPHLVVEEEAVARVLRDVCMAGTPALLFSAEAAEHAQVRFVSLGPEVVTLEIDGQRADAVFRPLSMCSVAFNHERRSRVFLAVVQCQEEPRPGHGPQVQLRRPQQIATSAGRMNFRVPVFAESGLMLELRLRDGRSVAPRALNLSYSGMLVDLPPGQGPRIRVGDEMIVRMGIDGTRFETEALVRRCDAPRHALVFPALFDRVDFEPPDELARIIRALEAHWLRQRIA